jgi:hypothetical protein
MLRQIPIFLIGLSLAAPIQAQTPSETTHPVQPASAMAQPSAVVAKMPKDPSAIMNLMAKTNGLAGLNDRPYHLKLTYQTFDMDGKPAVQGELEEWWVSDKKYKYIYSYPGFRQTTYRNGKTEEVTGDPGWPIAKALADHVEGFLWTPLPRAGVAANASYQLQQRTMGEIILTCLQPQSMEVSQLGDSVTLMEMNANRVPTTCFSDGLPVARMEIMRDGMVVAMNHIMEHDGHYIAKQIALYDAGQQVVVMNVEQLEFPASISDAEMPKPDEAPVKEDAGPVVPYRLLAKRFISGDRLEYPKEARDQKLAAFVLVSMDIDTNGRVVGTQGVVGPKVLVDSVGQKLKTWKFRPYEAGGKPVQVSTWVWVNFLP